MERAKRDGFQNEKIERAWKKFGFVVHKRSPKLIRRLPILLSRQGERVLLGETTPNTIFYWINLNNLVRPVVEAAVFGATASLAKPTTRSRAIDTFAALQLQIHNDLRTQHPEWIEANGESPMCDFYEARLAQLLEAYAQTGSDESAAAVHRALEERATVDHLAA